jgi:hypothetical protein
MFMSNPGRGWAKVTPRRDLVNQGHRSPWNLLGKPVRGNKKTAVFLEKGVEKYSLPTEVQIASS